MARLDDDGSGLRTCGMALLVLGLVVWAYGFWWASILLKR